MIYHPPKKKEKNNTTKSCLLILSVAFKDITIMYINIKNISFN